MKVPAYIQTALDQRKKYAERLVHVDTVISEFCEKNNIKTEYINLHAGVVCEPDVAYENTLNDIINN